MNTTPLPPLPTPKGKVWPPAAFDDDQMQAYATAACADLGAENADLKRKLAEASNTLCIGGQMISAIAAELKGSNHDH